MRLLSASLAFIVIVGCSYSNSTVNVSGLYYNGHATSAFIPCHSQEIWWLDGNNEEMNNLFYTYSNLVKKEFDYIYITIQGDYKYIGTGDDYVGIVELTKLKDYSIDINKIKNCKKIIQ